MYLVMTPQARLAALLTADHQLAGRSTEPALRELGRLEVRLAFERVAAAFEAAELDHDEAALATVEAALALRLAVAVRWGRAGASPLERSLAAEVDRQLAPHRAALLYVDVDDEIPGQVDTAAAEGASIDPRTWWGFMGGESWALASEIAERGLAELAAAAAFPPPGPDRHAVAWNDPPDPAKPYCETIPPSPFWEVARWRYDEDMDRGAELAMELQDERDAAWSRWAEKMKGRPAC